MFVARSGLIVSLAFVTLLFLAGCGGSHERLYQKNLKPETTIQVENRNSMDMTVFVVNGGMRVRLGMVGGHSTREMTIPEDVITGEGMMQFMLDPVGSAEAPVTESIYVKPGERVKLIVFN